MRILAIVADIDPNNLGGAEWHFVEVLKGMLPKIEKVILVTGPRADIREQFLITDKVSVIPIEYPHVTNLYGLMFIIFSLPKVIVMLREEKVDLIWAKQEFPQGVVGAILKILFKIPLYVTCQSARLNKDELVIKGPMPRRIKDFLSDLAYPFMRLAFSRADIVGAVSSFSAEQVRKMGGKKVVVVPNGVRIEMYRKERREKNNELRIVTTSSLIPRNGIDTLIEGCALLPKDINWRLVIAGEGPERDQIEKIIRAKGIGSRVKLLGRVLNKEIPRLLAESDIFVRVSRAEGFGSSFIEAMAAGIPVIASPLGGIIDFVVDHKTGVLISPDNPARLAEAIQELFTDHTLYQYISKEAYKMVQEKYSWREISNKVYRQFLEITSARR